MDLSVVGQVMSQHAKLDTLEKVNVSLLKNSNQQAEQQATQLLQSVAPVSEGNKGKNIDLHI